MHANATPNGSHQEGTVTNNDYVLDRSKYRADPFFQLSSAIHPYLADQVANADGFVTSAYFNAQMMGLSVAILNGFKQGTDISGYISQVGNLNENEQMHAWLVANRGETPLLRLLSTLQKMTQLPPDNMSGDERIAAIKLLDNQIDEEADEFATAKAQGDRESKERAADSHDQHVRRLRILIATEKRREALYDKVDVEFNQCLDSKILLSRFEQVDLTSHAPEIESQPDN